MDQEMLDWCYECTGYGDDYSVSEDGEWVRNCEGCIHNGSGYLEDDWDPEDDEGERYV